MLMLLGCGPLEVFDDPTQQAPEVDSPEPERTPPPQTGDDPMPVDHEETGVTDSDGDGVYDRFDNCVDVPNPEQGDFDVDGIGNLCDDERDGDGIPDDRDLFPRDPDLPGVSSPDTVYAHGPNDLHAFNVNTNTIRFIGNFSFDMNGGSITDIAIDRYGVLYAITFSHAFVCNPQDAECWHIGALAGSYNGLTFIPPAQPGGPERLVGIAINGSWTQYDGVPYALNPSGLGSYTGGYGSSGDAFHINGTGTFAAVTGGASGVQIVEVTPSAQVLRTVADGFGGIYGIAGWSDTIYAFASNGNVVRIDPTTGDESIVASGPSWWGAGVKTYVVPPP
jgi:hypothetical protein